MHQQVSLQVRLYTGYRDRFSVLNQSDCTLTLSLRAISSPLEEFIPLGFMPLWLTPHCIVPLRVAIEGEYGTGRDLILQHFVEFSQGISRLTRSDGHTVFLSSLKKVLGYCTDERYQNQVESIAFSVKQGVLGVRLRYWLVWEGPVIPWRLWGVVCSTI